MGGWSTLRLPGPHRLLLAIQAQSQDTGSTCCELRGAMPRICCEGLIAPHALGRAACRLPWGVPVQEASPAELLWTAIFWSQTPAPSSFVVYMCLHCRLKYMQDRDWCGDNVQMFWFRAAGQTLGPCALGYVPGRYVLGPLAPDTFHKLGRFDITVRQSFTLVTLAPWLVVFCSGFAVGVLSAWQFLR